MGGFRITTQAIAGIPALFYCYSLQKLIPALDPLGSVCFSPFVTTSISNIICTLAAIVLVVLARRAEVGRLRRGMLIAGTLSQVAYAAIWIAFSFTHPILAPIATCAALLFRSVGIVFVSALWIELCATLNPVRASFLNAVCIAISLALYFFTMDLGEFRIGVLSVVLPIVICLSCWRAQRQHLSTIAPSIPPKRRVPLLRRTAVFVAVYSLTSNIVTSTIETEHSRFASLIPALVIIVFILFHARQFNIAVLYRIAFPLMVGGFLLASIVTSSLMGISGIVLDAGSAAMGMLLFLVVCSLSFSTGASALRLFGMLSAVQFATSFLGAAIGEFLHMRLSATSYAVLFALVVIAVVLVSCYFMSEDSMRSFWQHRDPQNDNQESSACHDCDRELKISSLGVSYSLTERETEILHLLSQGKSNSDMSNVMFISESTVKTHLHHIYQKFGVHTRRELEDMIADGRS